jgi:rod shape-determining protein MreC
MQSLFKKNYFLFIMLIVAFGFVIFLAKGKEEKPLEGFLHTVTKPFALFFSASGSYLGEKVSFFSSIGELKRENERVLKSNTELKIQIAQLRDVESENIELREGLSLAPRDKYDLEAALIIGKDLRGKEDVVYINKGKKDGIEKNMAVVVERGVLIGRILKALDRSAQVELILDKDIQVNAEIQESEAKGIVHGEYGTAAVLDMIPQTMEVKPGDTVITSGLGGNFPRGLLIGYAKEAMTTPDKLFQKSSLVLPVELNNLRMIWVVKKTFDTESEK